LCRTYAGYRGKILTVTAVAAKKVNTLVNHFFFTFLRFDYKKSKKKKEESTQGLTLLVPVL